MSIRKKVEPLSEHPLFRALVLMGGGLAVGCGGVAEREAPVDRDFSSSGSANGGAVSTAAGGAFMTGIPAAGAPSAAGASSAAGANAADFYHPSCPYEQWDCSALLTAGACYLLLQSTDDPVAAGCSCDSSRPTSAAACKLDESFVCWGGNPLYVEGRPSPSTWDGSFHVQCACVATPQPGYENCAAMCSKLLGTATPGPPMRCSTAESTCDVNGVCTATSADVLRQDGIMCGCADIGLK